MCIDHPDYEEIEQPNLINPAKVERLLHQIESHRGQPLLISHNKQSSRRYPAKGCFNSGYEEHTISYSELILGVISHNPIKCEPYLHLTLPITLPLICKNLNVNDLASMPPDVRLDTIQSLGPRILGDLDKPFHEATILMSGKAKRNQTITGKKLEIIIGQQAIEEWVANYAEKDFAFAEVYFEMARLLKLSVDSNGPLRTHAQTLRTNLQQQITELQSEYEKIIKNHPELQRIQRNIEKHTRTIDELPPSP